MKTNELINRRSSLFNANVLGNFSQMVNQALQSIETVKNSDEVDFQLYSSDEGWVLQIDAAGLSKEDMSLEYEDGELKVSSEDENFGFQKSFMLGKDVDPEKISARFENGILELTLPKTNNKKSINIQ